MTKLAYFRVKETNQKWLKDLAFYLDQRNLLDPYNSDKVKQNKIIRNKS